MSTFRVIDTECYPNYFLILALDPITEIIYRWEKHNDTERGRERGQLVDMLGANIAFTFNGLGYDWHMMSAYAHGFDNTQLHQLSTWLITTEMAQWRVDEEYEFVSLKGDHIDLMPVAPMIASLKIYAGRLNAPKLQDLPISPYRNIDSEDTRDTLIQYCMNDLQCTNLLRRKMIAQVQLRRSMGIKYDLPLTSKSDPQIAEMVLKKLLTESGVKVRKATSVEGPFRYRKPKCVEMYTDDMRDAVRVAEESEYELSAKGSLLCPRELRRPIEFNSTMYQMGIGGLHSMEKSRAVTIKPGQSLTDLDVTSYYPSLILTNRLFPSHLTDKFIDVYQGIVDDRVAAKMDGDKVTADALKIVVNSSFGKFGNKYSILYSPKLLLQTTISGQLYLLMLIEKIELRTACRVVSANTDGITVFSPNPIMYKRMRSIAQEWERQTAMALEAVEYSALYSQDVNNYFAVKLNGDIKGKGVFAHGGLAKNPHAPIIANAVTRMATTGETLHQSIRACKDIRAFSMLRKVTGGALYGDDEVGSTVRWYHSTQGRPLLYRKNCNRVPGADKAMLINELPERCPNDIDFDEYVFRANELAMNVGLFDTLDL